MGIVDFKKRIEKMIDRLNTVPEVVELVVRDQQDTLVSLNKDQMLLGRNTDGKVLTPDYLSDPYFKTREEALFYARMKYRLESQHNARISHPLNYPNKGRNTPNLIVTGPFQDAMRIRLTSDAFFIDSGYNESKEIERKYQHKVFGLSPESREYFYEKYIKPKIKKHLNV